MKKKRIKAWAVLVPKVSTGKDSLFRSGLDCKYGEARIFRTKRLAETEYPLHKIRKCEIKII